jgi:acyl-CoA synthetase (AMP-forming)/AMP-acid ligase II
MASQSVDRSFASVIPTGGVSTCSDLSVLPSDSAPSSLKELWWLHGHPHSKRYSDPKLTNLAALVRNNGKLYKGRPGFLYPITAEPQTSYKTLSWDEYDIITESLAAAYAHELLWELQHANESRKQPTIALLGRGTTIEYFCTQLALQKLGLRVLLLAESNSVASLHYLLDSCNVSAVITDTKNAGADIKHIRRISMIEDISQNVTAQQTDVDAVKYQDFEDVWERHAFILHSSGSTGVPKPIIHTNRSLMLIARMYRLFPDFEIKNWFLLFPL